MLLKTLRKFGLRWALGLLLTLAACAHIWGVIDSDDVDRFDGYLSGLRMRIEQPVLDPRVVIVDIDEKSLALVGRFPWSRDVQAQLVEQLTRHYQAGAVGFDVSFPEPDTSSGYEVLAKLARNELKGIARLDEQLAVLKPAMDYDGLFAAALQGQPVVLGYNVSSTAQRKGVLPAPAFTAERLNGREVLAYTPKGYEGNIARLQNAAAGAGIFTALQDEDGVLRTAPLLMQIGDGYYPALSLATASVYLKARSIFPHFEETADNLSDSELASGGIDKLLLFTPKGQLPIPVALGLVTTVQYRGKGGPAGGAFRYISAVDVLTGQASAAHLKNAIVLVGTTAPGLLDLRVTPVNPAYPGVEVHANIIKSILDGRFKTRPHFAQAIEFFQVLLAGLVLGGALGVLSPLRSILLTLGVLAAALGFNYAMYATQDYELRGASLLLLIMALFVLNIAYGYFFEQRKGKALVSRFGEYVAPELVAEMAESPEKYDMEGESRELTVMFVDVRGFTTISEGLSPKELREYINLYLTAMSEDIRSAHHGTLDKYIGDAVMAFWGAPVAFDDHASRAVATALRMQESAARLDGEFRARGWPALKIGIGVNSGLMHVGDMGSKIRRAYTVMGDAVNLASRLEGVTKVYGVGIAVGEATRRAAPAFAYRELDLVRVKGKHEPVAIFQPLAPASELDAAALAALARWDQALRFVRTQQWDAAEEVLMELASSQPGDSLIRLYLDRIAQYRIDPPGTHWDGVTTFDTK